MRNIRFLCRNINIPYEIISFNKRFQASEAYAEKQGRALRLSILLNQNPPDNKKEQVKSLLGYINKTIYESLPDKKKIEYSLVL